MLIAKVGGSAVIWKAVLQICPFRSPFLPAQTT
jgi:hypothetical protein